MSDSLIKLIFKNQNCRGEVLHLDETWRSAMRHQQLPECVRNMLGEMTCAAVMMSATLKFEGSLVLQLQGDGPVKIALVEVRNGLVFRATAQLRVPAEKIDPASDFKSLVNANGNGRCALILDFQGRRPGEQPYQGVVVLDDAGVAPTIEQYLEQSEQIATRLWLSSGENACGGVLLQIMPGTGGTAEESTQNIDPQAGLNELSMYAKTIKPEELQGLDAEDIARRLFWETNPQVLGNLPVTFKCRCSRTGIEMMVRSLGKDEAKSIIAERGVVEVRCEFCGAYYRLDKVDVDSLFADSAFSGARSETAH